MDISDKSVPRDGGRFEKEIIARVLREGRVSYVAYAGAEDKQK